MNLQAAVVVVGGGPTGMLLAAELALAGIDVVVVERRMEPVPQARALSIQPRTIEIMALRGLADRFIEQGVKVPTGHYASLDTRLDFTRLDSSCAFGLLIPQTVTESLLKERASELGAVVKRGWIVERVEDMGDKVLLRGSGVDGEFTIEARYVVGADGARSIVRQQIGIDFPGDDSSMSLYFGDVFIEQAPIPTTGRFQIRNGMGIMEGFPKSDGRHRIVFIDAERLAVPVATPVTLEEMQDGTRRIMGSGAMLRDPTWMSRFGNESRLAEDYRRGRVFVAGDAAHIHLPAGGQGMNTGLQDAMNLGWKLAGVIRGWAPEALLDSYDVERRPVGKRLIDNTRAQGDLILNLLREGDALWNAFNELLGIPEANLHLTQMITAIETIYPEPLAGLDAWPANRWTGMRLRDAALRLSDGSSASLYSLLQAGRWVDLRLKTGAAPQQLSALSPEWVWTCEAEPTEETSVLKDLSSILIRPDGHIAVAA